MKHECVYLFMSMFVYICTLYTVQRAIVCSNVHTRDLNIDSLNSKGWTCAADMRSGHAQSDGGTTRSMVT